MESFKYEGFYHCMHNHLTEICSLTLRRKTKLDLLLKSQWMKKWQEEAGDNQFFTRQQWKYITISRVLQRRHHNSCVISIVID
jgi:hypothetical protein